MAYTIEHCIVDYISNTGPQDEAELREECRTQCSPYTKQLFNNAIIWLVSEGTIIVDHADNGDVYYAFPDNYYLPQ